METQKRKADGIVHTIARKAFFLITFPSAIHLQVRFLTKIYHPNIDKALLSVPNPDDPLSDNIAEHWKANEAEAVETAYFS